MKIKKRFYPKQIGIEKEKSLQISTLVDFQEEKKNKKE
jgi:hypothetical protein